MYTSHSSLLVRVPLNTIKSVNSSPKQDVLFLEGLYLSSPEFWHELTKSDTSLLSSNLKNSLLKYWKRSCARCTPYGTFAGCGIVHVSEGRTDIVLAESERYQKYVRLDMNYISLIINHIQRIPALKEKIRFFVNNSLYEYNNEYRYVEYSVKNNTRFYNLTSVKKSEYLSAILELARVGVTVSEACKQLVSLSDFHENEIFEYVGELIDSQILLSELEPNITGAEALEVLILKLEQLNVEVIKSTIEELKLILGLINNPSSGVQYYQKIENLLKKLNPEIDVPKNTIQVDLFLEFEKRKIEKGIVDRIVEECNDLLALYKSGESIDLQSFKADFITKFDGQEIPLLYALDADIGAGYAKNKNGSSRGGELIDDLIISQMDEGQNYTFDHLQQLSLKKYYEFQTSGATHIELKKSDFNIKSDDIKRYKFPSSAFLMGQYFSNGPQDFLFELKGFGGPSAGSLLGRFSHGNKDVKDLTVNLLQEEENEDKDSIYAEIAHLPQARIGNILMRPVLRKFEIPYVGTSGADPENQIPVTDLVVGIKNGSIYLKSKRLNKLIIPRLTTAHNYTVNSLPIYKFLCDLQRQNLFLPNSWDWGVLESFEYLPRVSYKSIIIRKARWIIDISKEEDLLKKKNNIPFFIQTEIKRRDIPCSVLLINGDNSILLNLEEKEALEIITKELNQFKQVILEENLQSEDNCIVFNEQGMPFCCELIIPLTPKAKVVKPISKILNDDKYVIPKEIFGLNSEWLFLKIYTGVTSSEKILIEYLLPFVEENSSHFEKFFFIRYIDESGYHLRIRFFNQDVEKNIELLRLLKRVFIARIEGDRVIHKIVTDTYSRELRRYTPILIEEIESIFFFDSVLVLKLLSLLGNEEKYRVFFAMRGIISLMEDFELTIEQKYSLVKDINENFFLEFGAGDMLKKQLNKKYKEMQKEIFLSMDSECDSETELNELSLFISERSFKIKRSITEIKGKLKDDIEFSETIFNILPSLIHMYMNRLFMDQQRKHELLVYHFLERFLNSQKALLIGKSS